MSPSLVAPALDSTYGAAFIGLLISAILFGVTNLQVFIYLQRNSEDRLAHKISAVWLLCIDALHFAITAHAVYHYLVKNYFNPTALLEIVWSFKFQVVVDTIVITSVHGLYTWRIWLVTPPGKQRILAAAVTIILMGAIAVGIVLCFEIYQIKLFTDFLKVDWAVETSLAVTTLLDIMIAGTMCYVLAKSRTGFSRTNSAISTLMVYILNTGLLTSLCSLLALITCITMPTNFVYLSISFLLSKLYINSYMALMNARKHLRLRAYNEASSSEFHGSSSNDLPIRLSPVRAKFGARRVPDTPSVQVSITREQDVFEYAKQEDDDDRRKQADV